MALIQNDIEKLKYHLVPVLNNVLMNESSIFHDKTTFACSK